MGFREARVGSRPDACLGKPRDAGSAEDWLRRGLEGFRILFGEIYHLKKSPFGGQGIFWGAAVQNCRRPRWPPRRWV